MARPDTLIVCLVLIAAGMAARPANADEHVLHPHDEVHNWGVWGKDDQKGAANYMTDERVVEAARLIRTGKRFSLAIPIDATGPVFPGRLNPHHTMVATGTDYAAGLSGPLDFGVYRFADDYIYMPLQGSTQWDGLSHGWYGDTLYNGVPQTQIGATGAAKLGMENLKDSMIGRGVLIDVVAFKGGPLPSGYSIRRADIEGALKKQGSKVLPGDIVIVRTGVVPHFYTLENAVERAEFWARPQAGIASDVVPWIKQTQVAAVATDNIAFERMPNEDDPDHLAPLHGNMLRDMGVYIGEIWWLEDLAADCAKDGRYEFFLAAQPLHIPGAVGSPLNPVAIK
ncbi:MAG: cyclase family protein [Deltaproteobacteria bacterium]|nr:cyclase family protein [Deltaproteobacteria bacterium]